MTLDEKKLRYKWIKSQQYWHECRNGKWHKNQAIWYKRQAKKVYSISDIVSMTIAKHAPQMASNIIANNAILKRMIAEGFYQAAFTG